MGTILATIQSYASLKITSLFTFNMPAQNVINHKEFERIIEQGLLEESYLRKPSTWCSKVTSVTILVLQKFWLTKLVPQKT